MCGHSCATVDSGVCRVDGGAGLARRANNVNGGSWRKFLDVRYGWTGGGRGGGERTLSSASFSNCLSGSRACVRAAQTPRASGHQGAPPLIGTPTALPAPTRCRPLATATRQRPAGGQPELGQPSWRASLAGPQLKPSQTSASDTQTGHYQFGALLTAPHDKPAAAGRLRAHTLAS